MSGETARFDPRLKQPFRLICSGASSTGKTRLFDDVLKNKSECMSPGAIDRLIVCYASFQEIYAEWSGLAPHVTFIKGLPSEKELEGLLKRGQSNLMVIDDLDDRENECETLHRIFTMHSHHLSCSVLYSQHNLFMRNKRSLLINRNANYLVLMPNHRDKAGIRALGYQVEPSDSMFLLEAFRAATEGERRSPFPFLLCDFNSDAPKRFWFREGFRIPFAYYVSKRDEQPVGREDEGEEKVGREKKKKKA